jgi:V8-like Glu-specific endopeptidase
VVSISTGGTGALIDPTHVLTNAHVVVDQKTGMLLESSVQVTPGQQPFQVQPPQLPAKPFGSANVTLARIYDAFPDFDTTDVALLTLDQPIGNSTGWFGVGYVSDLTSYDGMSLNTAGYPGTPFSGVNQFNQYGPIISTQPDVRGNAGAELQWNTSSITTVGGQSGSPLWVYDPSTGQRTIYGVLARGPDDRSQDFQGSIGPPNFGERITPSIFADLQTWKAEDAASPPSGPLR